MKDFFPILPEIFLALTLAFVIFGEITYHGERYRLISLTALLGLASALVQTILTVSVGPTMAFSGALSIDGLTFIFRVFFILLAGISIVAAMQSDEIATDKRAEYVALILAATLGMSLAAASVDLLLLFLSLQFVNIAGFFLAGYSKKSLYSNEAGLKYMILASVCGGFLLYGMAMYFGGTQLANLFEIHRVIVAAPLAPLIELLAFCLIFLAFAFQVGAFPMYFWVPDVLQGAPTPASSFLAVGPRFVGFAVGIRIFFSLFSRPSIQVGTGGARWEILGSIPWPSVIAWVAGATMLIGALLALRQTSAKRMLAGLVITQTGALLLGFLVLDWSGVAALLYNLFVDLFAVTGAYFVLSFLVNELESDRLEDLRGILKWAPLESIALILFMISIVGLPPMPGFIGRFSLIGAALGHGWTALAGVAVLASALSAVSVARLSFSLVGDFSVTPERALAMRSGRTACVLGLMMALFLLGVFAQTFIAWGASSIGAILW